MFEVFEPVTVCDQFLFFDFGKLKAESIGKAGNVSFVGLVENLDLDTVKSGKVGINHDLDIPENVNQFTDDFFPENDGGIFLVRHNQTPPSLAFEVAFCDLKFFQRLEDLAIILRQFITANRMT